MHAWAQLREGARARPYLTRDHTCATNAQGSHKKGVLLEHGYPDWGNNKVNKAYHGITSFDESWVKDLVYLEMQPGDTVIFHPLLIHGSGARRLDVARRFRSVRLLTRC